MLTTEDYTQTCEKWIKPLLITDRVILFVILHVNLTTASKNRRPKTQAVSICYITNGHSHIPPSLYKAVRKLKF